MFQKKYNYYIRYMILWMFLLKKILKVIYGRLKKFEQYWWHLSLVKSWGWDLHWSLGNTVKWQWLPWANFILNARDLRNYPIGL